MTQADDDAAVARTYREFGRYEARGRSAAYQELAEAVAGDAALVSFIASLPPDKRQPPPAVHRGDLLTDLPALAAQAPADATLVVYHTSVLWYVAAGQRDLFGRTVRGLGATWLSSEPPGVVPGTAGPARDGHTCVVARDGRGLALTESHRTWLEWLT